MYDFPPGSWAVRMKTAKEQGMVCGPRNPQARSCRPVSYGGMLVAGRVGTEEPREKLLASAFNISKPPLFLKNPNPQCNRHAPEDGRRRDEKREEKKNKIREHKRPGFKNRRTMLGHTVRMQPGPEPSMHPILPILSDQNENVPF